MVIKRKKRRPTLDMGKVASKSSGKASSRASGSSSSAKKPAKKPAKYSRGADPWTKSGKSSFDDEKQTEIINGIIGELQKSFGSKSAQLLDSDTVLCKVTHSVSTRCFAIDALIRGWDRSKPMIPFGRLTEVAGLEATGKTSLLAGIMSEVQSQGGICCLADTEEAIDVGYFGRLGVDLGKVIMVQPDHMEDVFDKFETLIHLIKKNAPKKLILIGWDSVAATPTKSEVEGKSEDSHPMAAARVISQNLRRLTAPIAKTKTGMIFNNHLYSKMTQYGDPLVSYGGNKLKYLATLRLRLTARGKLKIGSGESVVNIGQVVEVFTKKNKTSAGFQKVRVNLLHDRGFCDDYLVFSSGVFKGSNWKTWETPKGEELKFQTWANFLDKIVTHPEYPSLIKEVCDGYYVS